VTSNYTFLCGASHPEELVRRAAELGLKAVAITDTNTLAGVVRAHVAAKEAGIALVVGCRLRLVEPEGLEVLVYPTDRASYARLSRLLTTGKRRAEKGDCRLMLADLFEASAGLWAVAVPPGGSAGAMGEFAVHLRALHAAFGQRLSLAVWRTYGAGETERREAVARLSAETGVPLVVTNRVLYHHPERRPLQDVLTCIRLGTTVDAAGYALEANGERHVKPGWEVARLTADHPGALRRGLEVVAATRGFSLDQLRYQYPREVTPEGVEPIEHLRRLVEEGAKGRYPAGVPADVAGAIGHEMGLIAELGYAPYFLTVHDLVTFARSRGILCQGRGAAANSAVCYCLGVTSVDPSRIQLLFERFISKERNEPPDIDIDFEHERREEVIQYIYGKYGRDRAALTAEVITYRGRSAVRDVGKALGLSLDAVDRLAKGLDWWESGAIDAERVRGLGFNPEDRTIRLLLHLCGQVLGFPRHLSQHVGGFVIADTALCELVPIENAAMPDRTVIEWDKDDVDAMGMLKVDCLGLGMLTCIRKAFELVRAHRGLDLSLATVPAEDPDVYAMLCRADTVGVFQVESRAQMAMLPRLRPRCFYDLVIEVAIVRPGPIQGKMVHPYLRRRNGEEAFSFPNEAVRTVLGRTLGVPLFQEQAMKLAIVAGGFTPGEADQLRRAMAAWKRKGNAIARFGAQLVAGMKARGYDTDFAERCFEQIKGFSEYGFPESHAASFALLVYVSSWLKHHEPAAFAAALINSQPMGFYQPAQIVRDAREHGVVVRPVCVNSSGWGCTLEPVDGAEPGKGARLAMRLGMRLVRGLSERHAGALVAARVEGGAFTGVADVARRARLPVAALRQLARADAFASPPISLDRRAALWAIQALKDEHLPLFDTGTDTDSAPGEDAGAARAWLPKANGRTRVREDYHATGLSLKAHPMSFFREALAAQGVVTAWELSDAARCPNGRSVEVAGVVLIRQRPGTASGIVFITLEDETGIANLIVRPRTYDRCRAAARHSPYIRVRGRVERSGAVVHVQAVKIARLAVEEETAGPRSRDFR
jgi:error-prone DNA polymerase